MISPIQDHRISIARLGPNVRYPELGGDLAQMSAALERLADNLGWTDRDRGPLAEVVAPNAHVLVKPNLVLHRNERTGGGWVELVTHPTLIAATSTNF